MSAPMGRMLTNYRQLVMRSVLLRRCFSGQNGIPSFAVNKAIDWTRCGPHLARNYHICLPPMTVTDAHSKYRLLDCARDVNSRNMSAAPSLSDEEVRKEIESITEKFMEAKEYLDDARDSIDSVYFDEDMKDAEDAIQETLSMYQDLLARLSEEQKQNVMRTIGLKMEELKAQLNMIKESLH